MLKTLMPVSFAFAIVLAILGLFADFAANPWAVPDVRHRLGGPGSRTPLPAQLAAPIAARVWIAGGHFLEDGT